MFRIVRYTPAFSFPIFDLSRYESPHDYDELNSPYEPTPTTGWERVKKMYSKTQYREVSVELQNVGQSAMCGAFFGACMGGFVGSKNAYLYFIENNQATIFKSTMQAKKKLQDYVLVAFAKNAVRWGWRLAIFTGFFSLVSTTISVYRGDTTLIEFVAAGAVTGGLYKINLGLAATFVGAGLGAVLATIFGGIVVGILKVTGANMVDLRRALTRFKEAREDQYNQAVEKSATIKNDDLTRHHDHLVERKGKVTIDQLK